MACALFSLPQAAEKLFSARCTSCACSSRTLKPQKFTLPLVVHHVRAFLVPSNRRKHFAARCTSSACSSRTLKPQESTLPLVAHRLHVLLALSNRRNLLCRSSYIVCVFFSHPQTAEIYFAARCTSPASSSRTLKPQKSTLPLVVDHVRYLLDRSQVVANYFAAHCVTSLKSKNRSCTLRALREARPRPSKTLPNGPGFGSLMAPESAGREVIAHPASTV